MATELSIAMVAIVFAFILFMIESGRAIKNKKYVKAYNGTGKSLEGFKQSKSSLETLGEWKSEHFNKERKCWEMRFRNSISNYFMVYSNFSIFEFLGTHLIDNVYLIFYLLRAQFYEKKVKPYKKELGWSVQAIAYRAICFLFNLSGTGLPGSVIICGCIFGLSFPSAPYAALIGMGVGPVISAINWKVSKLPEVQKSLLTKKMQFVDTEIYLVPLESEYEVAQIFKVRGNKFEMVKTIDEVKEPRIKQLKTRNKKFKAIQTTDMSEEPRTRKFVELRDKDSGLEDGHLTVKGFDELYNLETDKTVTLLEVVATQQYEIRKRTDEEFKNYHRSYLARNSYFAKQVFDLNEENEKLQKENESLQMQLQSQQENEFRKINGALEVVTKEKERLENVLPAIYKEIMGGKFVGENLKSIHLKVMRILRKEELLVGVNEINLLYKTQIEILNKLKEKTSVDFDDIIKKLEYKPGIEARTNGKEKAKATETTG